MRLIEFTCIMMPRPMSVLLIVRRSRSRYSREGNRRTICKRLRKYKTQVIWQEIEKIRIKLDKNNTCRLQVIRGYKTASEEKGWVPRRSIGWRKEWAKEKRELECAKLFAKKKSKCLALGASKFLGACFVCGPRRRVRSVDIITAVVRVVRDQGACTWRNPHLPR